MPREVPQLAVLGSPIAHSKSPAIHQAAYRILGLDWDYRAIEVRSGGLGDFLSMEGPSWRGLSLTMPLKREILPFLDQHDDTTFQVGAANTVLFDGGRLLGFNTDVYGASRMIREAFPGKLIHAHLLGGGATACSLALALAKCGASKLTVGTRSPADSQELVRVAQSAGLEVVVANIESDPGAADLVVSTLPGDVKLTASLSARLTSTVPLLDVAYAPWPTAVAKQWLNAGGFVVSDGLGMLIHQALAQIRIFVNGDPLLELPAELELLTAMRSAVRGPA